jgi:drug/metabolite transporter (DMT)-like permease
VAIWAAIVFVPIYVLFLPKTLANVQPLQLVGQVVFHGVFVVIVATLTYAEAIKRLGAFKTGSIATLAPFIAAILAVPLLHEPLSNAMIFGLIGMGVGALQPWRWLMHKDPLQQKIDRKKQRS